MDTLLILYLDKRTVTSENLKPIWEAILNSSGIVRIQVDDCKPKEKE